MYIRGGSESYYYLTSKGDVEEDDGIDRLPIAVSHAGRRTDS